MHAKYKIVYDSINASDYNSKSLWLELAAHGDVCTDLGKFESCIFFNAREVKRIASSLIRFTMQTDALTLVQCIATAEHVIQNLIFLIKMANCRLDMVYFFDESNLE